MNAIAPITEPTTLSLALVRSDTNTATENTALPWESWGQRLTLFAVRPEKNGAGFIPAVMNGTRKADNVAHYTALVLDVEPRGEDVPPDPAEAGSRLAEAGITGVIYTSHNHLAPAEINGGKPQGPRYRIVVPLADPMPPAALGANVELLAARLGLAPVVDPASRTRGQFFYLPSHRPDAPHFAVIIEGEFWKPIEAEPIAEPAPRPPAQHHAATGPECRVDSETWERAKTALGQLGAEFYSNYQQWLKIGMTLHSTGHPDAYEVWCDWSAQASSFDPTEAAKKWASFGEKFNGLTIGTLFHLGREQWPEPLSLTSALQPPTPYPLEAFPPLARAAIAAIAYHVDAPLALAGQCVLGCLTYLAQNVVNAPDVSLSPEGMPASLFILTEGASGDRKTACQTLADRIPHKLERERMEGFMAEVASYRGLSRKEREGQPEPLCPKTLYSDTTLEPVISAFINGAPHAMLSSDEAGQFFAGHSLKSETAKSAIGCLTKLWSSGVAERTRSASNPAISGAVYDCRLSLNLLGQREVIGESLLDPVLRGQGLLPRCLLAAPDSLAGTRFHRPSVEDSPYRDARLLQYWDRCRLLLGFSEDGLPPDLSAHLEGDILAKTLTGRRVIPLEGEAGELAKALYVEFERAQGKGGSFEFLRPFAARAEENARRVATVLAYFEGQPSITGEIMQAACQIVRYSLNEWKRYSEAPEADPANHALILLDNWLIEQAKGSQGRVFRSDILTRAPHRSQRKAKTLDEALHTLTDAGRIREAMHEGKAVVMVNPALLK